MLAVPSAAELASRASLETGGGSAVELWAPGGLPPYPAPEPAAEPLPSGGAPSSATCLPVDALTWRGRELAACLPDSHAVLLWTLGDADARPAGGLLAPGAPEAAPPPALPSRVLSHPVIAFPSTVSWRPQAPRTLAVGCRGGVALWRVRPARRNGPAAGAAAAAPETLSFFRAPPEALSGGGRLRRLLAAALAPAPAPADAAGSASASPLAASPTALAWSPDGALLAAAFPALRGGVVLFDAATGDARIVGPGPRDPAYERLAWSPCGGFLAASGCGGALRVFAVQAGWVSSRFDPSTKGARRKDGTVRSVARDVVGPGAADAARPPAHPSAGVVGLAWAPLGASRSTSLLMTLYASADASSAPTLCAFPFARGAAGAPQTQALPAAMPLLPGRPHAAAWGAWAANAGLVAVALHPEDGSGAFAGAPDVLLLETSAAVPLRARRVGAAALGGKPRAVAVGADATGEGLVAVWTDRGIAALRVDRGGAGL